MWPIPQQTPLSILVQEMNERRQRAEDGDELGKVAKRFSEKRNRVQDKEEWKEHFEWMKVARVVFMRNGKEVEEEFVLDWGLQSLGTSKTDEKNRARLDHMAKSLKEFYEHQKPVLIFNKKWLIEKGIKQYKDMIPKGVELISIDKSTRCSIVRY